MQEGFALGLGAVLLLGAKFLVYRWYLGRLGARWGTTRNTAAWAIARIALGAAIGALVWALFPGDRASLLSTYFAAMAGGRALAWVTILALAYARDAGAAGLAGATLLGVVLSYVVEIPIVLGLFGAIGGIC